MRVSTTLLSCLLLALGACDIYPSTPTPDYAIRVVPTDKGMVALPPPCPSWNTAVTDPYDNQPLPQFGCASARNLALMVERPNDLVHGRELGPESGVNAVGTMARYNNNQTRGLLWTGTDPNQVALTTSTTASSSLSGEVPTTTPSTGASSSSSSPSSP